MMSKNAKPAMKYWMIALSAVVLAAALVVFFSRVVPSSASPQSLTTYSAEDASAYRWASAARFYAGNANSTDLTSYNAADASVYRWNAVARFYQTHIAAAAQPQLIKQSKDWVLRR